jgi:hypothetical protein
MMVIDNKYEIGQTVYLKTDVEQLQRIVSAITQRQGTIIYELCCGKDTSGHYDFEITEDENVEIKVR